MVPVGSGEWARWGLVLVGFALACTPPKKTEPLTAIPSASGSQSAVPLPAVSSLPAASATGGAEAPRGASLCSFSRVLWAPGSPRFVAVGCGAAGRSLFLVELGAETGVREIDGDDHEMAWSADGSRFTTGRGLLLDTRSLSVLSSPEILDKDGQGTGAGFYPKSSFSADGETFLVTNAQSRMWFLDARSGKVKKVTREFVASPATGSTTSYWSPTGASLLAVADPGSVRLMTGRGNVVKLLPESANSVLWSPRSTHFLLESMTAGLLLYKADGALVKKLAPPSSEEPGPVDLQFSGDGQMIVARKKILREDGSMVRPLDGVTSLDFSPDNRSLAWTDARGVWVGPLKGDGSMLRPVQPSEALEVRWLPDGKRLLLENNQRIEVWDIESKKIAFPAVTKEPASDARAAAGPDGWFAIPGRGVKLLRVRDGKQLDVFVEQDKKHSTVLLAGRDGSFCGDKELATRHLSPPPGSPPTARPCPEILAAP